METVQHRDVVPRITTRAPPPPFLYLSVRRFCRRRFGISSERETGVRVPAKPIRVLHHAPRHYVFESKEGGEADGVDLDGCTVGPSRALVIPRGEWRGRVSSRGSVWTTWWWWWWRRWSGGEELELEEGEDCKGRVEHGDRNVEVWSQLPFLVVRF